MVAKVLVVVAFLCAASAHVVLRGASDHDVPVAPAIAEKSKSLVQRNNAASNAVLVAETADNNPGHYIPLAPAISDKSKSFAQKNNLAASSAILVEKTADNNPGHYIPVVSAISDETKSLIPEKNLAALNAVLVRQTENPDDAPSEKILCTAACMTKCLLKGYIGGVCPIFGLCICF